MAENPTVAKLAAGEVIQIEYSSSGCFHKISETYLISGGDQKLFTVLPGKTHAKKLHEPLTAAEVMGLDRLFQYYRKGKKGFGCTTVDEIKITYERNGKVIGKESFEDSACQSVNDKELVLFYQIVQRLEKPSSPPTRTDRP